MPNPLQHEIAVPEQLQPLEILRYSPRAEHEPQLQPIPKGGGAEDDRANYRVKSHWQAVV